MFWESPIPSVTGGKLLSYTIGGVTVNVLKNFKVVEDKEVKMEFAAAWPLHSLKTDEP